MSRKLSMAGEIWKAEINKMRREREEKIMPRSWKPEVIADSTGKWYSNALRFATKEEAEASARELSLRWLAVREHRAVESDDPVNYRWNMVAGLERIEE